MKVVLFDSNEKTAHVMKSMWDGESFHSCVRDMTGIDIFVSPANGIGVMDGGIDFFYKLFFNDLGVDIEKLVKEEYKRNYDWDVQQPGDVCSVETGLTEPKYFFPLTTMPIPRTIPQNIEEIIFAGTFNAVYLGLSIEQYLKETENGPDNFKELKMAIPGIATGSVGVPHGIAVSLMVGAIKSAINEF
jgi:O-acetyl-ADP-ribose deacetylase (regulator of RNase III)